MQQKEIDTQSLTGFTIVTPVFNREDCIGRCIESVVSQHYGNFEHWIVDDGSTDTTSVIIEEYAAKYEWIKYHKFEENKGVNAARNYAIKNASKEFVIFLDSDDCFADDALAIVNNNIKENPGYKHYLFAQDDRVPLYEQHEILKQGKVELTFADFLSERVNIDFVHVMDAGLVKKYPFDEQLRIYEVLTFLQLYKDGEKQLFINIAINKIERHRQDSVTKEALLNNKNALFKQYTALKRRLYLFEDDYIRLGRRDTMSQILNRVFILGIALDEYKENKNLRSMAKKYDITIPPAYRFLDACRLGVILRRSIFTYSKLKNK